jgi:hypothetical protein
MVLQAIVIQQQIDVQHTSTNAAATLGQQLNSIAWFTVWQQP